MLLLCNYVPLYSSVDGVRKLPPKEAVLEFF